MRVSWLKPDIESYETVRIEVQGVGDSRLALPRLV